MKQIVTLCHNISIEWGWESGPAKEEFTRARQTAQETTSAEQMELEIPKVEQMEQETTRVEEMELKTRRHLRTMRPKWSRGDERLRWSQGAGGMRAGVSEDWGAPQSRMGGGIKELNGTNKADGLLGGGENGRLGGTIRDKEHLRVVWTINEDEDL
jgi:hypothetical protein